MTHCVGDLVAWSHHRSSRSSWNKHSVKLIYSELLYSLAYYAGIHPCYHWSQINVCDEKDWPNWPILTVRDQERSRPPSMMFVKTCYVEKLKKETPWLLDALWTAPVRSHGWNSIPMGFDSVMLGNLHGGCAKISKTVTARLSVCCADFLTPRLLLIICYPFFLILHNCFGILHCYQQYYLRLLIWGIRAKINPTFLYD
jgi:hypothetical protein